MPRRDPTLREDRQHLLVRHEPFFAVLRGGLPRRTPRIQKLFIQRHNLIRRRAHQHLMRGDPFHRVRARHHRRRRSNEVTLTHDSKRRRRERRDRLRVVAPREDGAPHQLADGEPFSVLRVVEHLEDAHRESPTARVVVVIHDPVLAHDRVDGSARLRVLDAVEHAPGRGVDQVHEDEGRERRVRGGVARAGDVERRRRRGDEDDVRGEVLEQRRAVAEDARPRVDDLVGGFRRVPDDGAALGGEQRRPRLRDGIGRRKRRRLRRRRFRFRGGSRRRQERVAANLVRALIHGEERHDAAVDVRGDARFLGVREHRRGRTRRVHEQRRRRLVRLGIRRSRRRRQREIMRGRERQNHVALDRAGVQVHDDRARAVVTLVDAEHERVLAVVRVVARGTPLLDRRVRVFAAASCTAAEEPPP
mmetsp:Transcript_8233/g.30065  ORF Transcript_8233/g.30065 Transcript_8233/m.30065 type:complete len:418 (+) Transcript_8233:292-1545(+)